MIHIGLAELNEIKLEIEVLRGYLEKRTGQLSESGNVD